MKNLDKMTSGELKTYLEDTHLTSALDNESRRDLFSLAWEYGHSNGHSEVENYYIDLSTLIDKIKE